MAEWLPNPRSVPRCHLRLAMLQVEGCKMPSICELPQGSAPGKFYRDAAFNADELLVEGLSDPEPIATACNPCTRSGKPPGSWIVTQTAARTRNLPMFFYVLPYVPRPPASRRLSVAHRGGRHNEAEATLHLLIPPPVGRLSVPGAGVVRAVMEGVPGCAAAQSNR